MTYPQMSMALGTARSVGAAEREQRRIAENQQRAFARASALLRMFELENRNKRRCRVRIITLKETANAS